MLKIASSFIFLFFYLSYLCLILESSTNGNDSENQLKTNETDEKATPLTLAQQILSKSNLEQLLDILGKQPKLVANGCDFLITVLDLFGRYMPAPLCISLTSSSEDNVVSSGSENERMEVKKNNSISIHNKFQLLFFLFRLMMKATLLYRWLNQMKHR